MLLQETKMTFKFCLQTVLTESKVHQVVKMVCGPIPPREDCRLKSGTGIIMLMNSLIGLPKVGYVIKYKWVCLFMTLGLA